MKRRRLITEAEATAWVFRGNGVRPMTEAEAVEWDAAMRAGDRPTLLRIKRACSPGMPNRRPR